METYFDIIPTDIAYLIFLYFGENISNSLLMEYSPFNKIFRDKYSYINKLIYKFSNIINTDHILEYFNDEHKYSESYELLSDAITILTRIKCIKYRDIQFSITDGEDWNRRILLKELISLGIPLTDLHVKKLLIFHCRVFIKFDKFYYLELIDFMSKENLMVTSTNIIISLIVYKLNRINRFYE